MASIPRLGGFGWRTAIGLASFIFALLAIGLQYARSAPVIRHAVIALPNFPDHSPALRVVLLSDIHIGNIAMDQARLASVVSAVNSTHPDLILLAGDFVVGHDASGAFARASQLSAPLSGLHAPLGVLAVMGNHDYWTAPTAIKSALGRAGTVVLDNRASRRGAIVVAGIGDSFSGHDGAREAIGEARRLGRPIIVLTHSPDIAPELPADVPLVLAGHTHRGQIVLPLIGPLLTRSPREGWKPLYSARYRCGLIHDPGRTIVVTAGVGSGTVPLRIGAPPDFWVLTLTHP